MLTGGDGLCVGARAVSVTVTVPSSEAAWPSEMSAVMAAINTTERGSGSCCPSKMRYAATRVCAQRVAHAYLVSIPSMVKGAGND